MWSIRFRKQDSLHTVEIDPDDVVFYAVMRRGPTMHINGKTAVKCTHVAEDENGGMELNMSLLDATHVEHLNEEFKTIGVLGIWKLLKPLGDKYPTFKLERLVSNADDFLAEAKSIANPEWVRKCYTII